MKLKCKLLFLFYLILKQNIKLQLFDVRNPIEVQNGSKPDLIQRGPYTYREVWEKRNIKFLGRDVLRFTPVVTLYFDRSMSAGDETDLITFVNIPAIVSFKINNLTHTSQNFKNLTIFY